MDNILVVGCIEALLLSLFLLTKKSKYKADFVLATYFIVLAVRFFIVFMESYNIANNFPLPWLIKVDSPFIFLHGPLLWLFVKFYTNSKFKLKSFHLIHLIPFVLYGIDQYIHFIFGGTEQKIQYLINEEYKTFLSFKVAAIVWCTLTPAYLISAIKTINKHSVLIQNYFSQTENIDFNWVKVLFKIGIIGYTMPVIVLMLDLKFELISYRNFEFFSLCITMIYILILAFYGHKQKNVFSNFIIENSELLTANNQVNKDNSEALVEKLLKHMTYNKPFTDPELDLYTLSKQLGVKTDQLSEILNTKIKKNFFDFINYHRVEEFKQRVVKPENNNLTILGIAIECGFNSKATFNRVFKNHTNITPSQYKKQNQ